MNCNRLEKRLIAYMDGKASGAERRDVEAHIAACAACRTRAREFGAVWGMLETLPEVEPSAAFDARLRARLAVEPERKSFWATVIPQPRLAFAVSCLLVFSLWLSSLPPAPVPGPPGPTEAEFKMIKDLPVLENYDMLTNFEVLSDLPATPAPAPDGE
jgi:anti-sigma factor RsiW